MGTPPLSGTDRRRLLAALGIGLPALAIRPAWAAADPMPLTAILERSRLGALTGFAVSDAATGQVLEAHQPDLDQPPASVLKILTALWVLEVLGPGYRFPTELRATGPVEGGVIRGDLVLAGSGDPVLDTDALGDLAAALRARGVTGVSGRFVVAAGALPGIAEIEPGQPVDAGYNPAISGMNLNFNRVFLAWGPGGGAARIALSAPGVRHDAPVAGIRAVVRGGGAPLGHRFDGPAEVWAVSPDAVSGRGSRWLPVRRPADYAGEVFRALAQARGVRLPAPEVAADVPGGTVLARHESPAFDAMMRDMLFHSTNLTAEVAGLRAAQAGGGAPRGLADSAGAMTAWARGRYGLRRAAFVNHSGLTDRSRMSPAEMLRVLERERGLAPLLRERPVEDDRGEPVPGLRVRLLAKTGTMHFTRGLAGYLEGARGRRLAFAILAADLPARGRLGPGGAAPAGTRDWTARARQQEAALLRRWAVLHL
jgi:D-alanyl-D-alanine carboxypeptidase/D-alanyl-D-alanine-endopeptidase (penicillin-binding protein 4)